MGWRFFLASYLLYTSRLRNDAAFWGRRARRLSLDWSFLGGTRDNIDSRFGCEFRCEIWSDVPIDAWRGEIFAA